MTVHKIRLFTETQEARTVAARQLRKLKFSVWTFYFVFTLTPLFFTQYIWWPGTTIAGFVMASYIEVKYGERHRKVLDASIDANCEFDEEIEYVNIRLHRAQPLASLSSSRKDKAMN